MNPSVYHFCTYFDINYLTRGLALYESLRRCCRKPFVLWVLCFDNETHGMLLRLHLPGLELITQAEFEADDAELIAAKQGRTRVEYYWTCTPSLPLYVLAHHPEVGTITYLDADLYFYSDPQPIYDELGTASIVIVEHRYAPEHLSSASTSGIYNVGWMSFRRDVNGLSCLNWWRERCLEWCYARYEDGKFGDQLYLDDWPQRFQGVVVLQHPGAGLAPWNLTRFDPRFGRSGPTVDGLPLIFYHFHGYRMVTSLTAQIAAPIYHQSSGMIRRLYLPYIKALARAEKFARKFGFLPTKHENRARRGIVRDSLERRSFLVRPGWLGIWLWRIGDWRRANWVLEELATQHHAAGDQTAARSLLLRLVRRNPLVLRRRSVVSMIMSPARWPIDS